MINEALRLIRVFHNLKQGTLAEKLGISQSHLSEVEKGSKQPTLELLQKYAAVFDMPVSSILFFAEKKGTRGRSSAISQTIAAKAIQMLSWVDLITDDKRKSSQT